MAGFAVGALQLTLVLTTAVVNSTVPLLEMLLLLVSSWGFSLSFLSSFLSSFLRIYYNFLEIQAFIQVVKVMRVIRFSQEDLVIQHSLEKRAHGHAGDLGLRCLDEEARSIDAGQGDNNATHPIPLPCSFGSTTLKHFTVRPVEGVYPYFSYNRFQLRLQILRHTELFELRSWIHLDSE